MSDLDELQVYVWEAREMAERALQRVEWGRLALLAAVALFSELADANADRLEMTERAVELANRLDECISWMD